MAEERIDIVVTDKVDAGVAKKLNQIADGAERADSYLTRLKSSLASVNATAVDRLAAAMAKADSAQARLLNAQARLTNALNSGAIAAQKVALANQKIATEAARTEAAQQRAAAATIASERAALALSAAQQRVAGSSTQAANAQQQLAAATAGAGNAAQTSGNSFRTYVAGIQAANAASMAAGPAGTQMAAGMNAASAASNQYLRAGRQTTAVNANIIAQMQDIGVSLAGGQNPLLVMIQQGSQLSYIASTMEGGVKALIGTIARMALAWAPVIAVVGAAIFAFTSFNDRLNEHSGIDAYVKSLGLTRQELKKLEDQHITLGDTASATFQVLSENILLSMGYTIDEVQSGWSNLMNLILKWTAAAFIGVGALTVTLVKFIAAVVVNIGKIFYNAGVAASNLFLKSIEVLVNGTVDGINAIGGAINSLSNAAGFGDVVGELNHIDLGVKNVSDGMMELSHVNPMETFQEAAQNSLDTLRRIGAVAEDNAKKRLGAQAADIIADRTPGRGRRAPEDHTAERRAHAIDMVNLKLDDELARMKLLKDERAVQARMDQIEEQLAQKKITLNDAERVSIENKVRAIEAYKYVQAEMDKIYESITEPARTYAAALQAITDLEGQHAISAVQSAQQTVLATRAFQEATDPLFALKEQLTEAENAVTQYGMAAQQAAFYEQVRQAELAKGNILSATYVAGVNAEVDALMRRNKALLEQQFIQSTLASIVDPMLQDQMMLDQKAAFYAEVDRMRQQNILSEQQAQQAIHALDAKYMEMRLQGASTFFSELAGLSSSGNKKLALIGKAAAMAQATIDGFVAVQKALASGPPPWNFLAASAVAVKTGVQLAGIASTNVGGFATGGQFMVDGKSGIDANNINMQVTKGERVTVETPAQQRANNGSGPTNVSVPVKIVNVRNPQEVLDHMGSEEGKRVIFNVLQDNPQELANIVQGANS